MTGMVLHKNSIQYDGRTIPLGAKAFYIDGYISEITANHSPYIFTNISDAVPYLTDGTKEEPMVLYLAPYVYWVDDPESEQIRRPGKFPIPYGLNIDCNYLTFYGLTEDPKDVVIAANRGQSQGAVGNFTNLHISGDGLWMENLTVGNYCNVDLNYKHNPSLSRKRRADTITQAQLVHCDGDKVVAVNCQFISRLNANPIISKKRVLMYQCHIESTDDALNATTVHLECDFDFYGNRPIYETHGTGAVFLNCTFHSKIFGIEAEPYQYITKLGGPVTIVDGSFESNYDLPVDIGWTKYPKVDLRCYQSRVSHNEKQILIGGETCENTVDMTGKWILAAYKVISHGKTIYNTYNLLCGEDDWDPMGVKEQIIQAEEEQGVDYTDIPTRLIIQSDCDKIESGETDAHLTYQIFQFGEAEPDLNFSAKFTGKHDAADYTLLWSIDKKDENYATLIFNEDGSCTLCGKNISDEGKHITVYGKTKSGLEAAYEILVEPKIIEAPKFLKEPEILALTPGLRTLVYELDSKAGVDQSNITWYRSRDPSGCDKFPSAVSVLGCPEQNYELTSGDIGYFLCAKIEPKRSTSKKGNMITVSTSEMISTQDVKETMVSTDFHNLPVFYQPQIRLGFWSVDSIIPDDMDGLQWEQKEGNSWAYKRAIDGAKGYGLCPLMQGARLLYTPVRGIYQDMSVSVLADPSKTQGQGFGSAGQYLDIYIKFDTKRLTGYALRIERTVKSARAVDFVLIKYNDGKTTKITDPVTASCFRTGCRILLSVCGGVLRAHVETTLPELPVHIEEGLTAVVDLSAKIDANPYGGSGVLFTGSTGIHGVGNITMLHQMQISWDQS